MTTLYLDTSFTRQDMSELAGAMPVVIWDSNLVKMTAYEHQNDEGFLLANRIEDSIKKPSRKMDHIKRLNKFYNSFLKDNKELGTIKLLTINLPVSYHMRFTSKQLCKMFKKDIATLRRIGAITRSFTCFEYSDGYKFHCHSIVIVRNKKQFEKRLRILRNKTNNCAYHISNARHGSVENWVKYIGKDILKMTSGREIEIQQGSYVLKDVLNYNPYETKFNRKAAVSEDRDKKILEKMKMNRANPEWIKAAQNHISLL